MSEQKTCVHSSRLLPIEAFHSWSTRQWLKYGKWCKSCYSTSSAARRKRVKAAT